MENNTRVFRLLVVVALMATAMLGGCTAATPQQQSYSFKHSIFGEDPVPMTADPVSNTE